MIRDLKNLEKKFPDYLFTISDDYSVLFEKKTQKTTSSSDNGKSSYGVANDFVFASNIQSLLSPATLASTVSTIIPLSFTKSKSIDCGLAAGAAVDFGTSSVKSTSTGVVAGGCTARGDLNNSILLPSAGVTSIKLKLNFSLEVSGYAVGVLSASGVNSSSGNKVQIDGQVGYIVNEHIYKTAFAPLLWVASFSQSKSFTINPDLTAMKGKTLKVNGYSHSYALSVICCATSGWGKLTITSASLTITN